MKQKLAKTYIQEKKSFHGKDNLLYTIAFHVAPVKEKHKPAVIINFSNYGQRLLALWEEHKQCFSVNIQLKYYEVKLTKFKAIVLFYDPELLAKVIFEPKHIRFLELYGYKKEMTLDQCLCHLQNRLKVGFAHELGLFLGIPLNDISSYINQQGKNAIGLGYWKVYHNLSKAKLTFAQYEAARMRFINFILAGNQPHHYLQS